MNASNYLCHPSGVAASIFNSVIWEIGIFHEVTNVLCLVLTEDPEKVRGCLVTIKGKIFVTI